MSDSVKNNTKLAVMEEVTEGTWLTPASGSDFILPLSDGFELTPAKELIERNVLNSSIGKTKPRHGTSSVAGSISVEAKANGTAGSYPQYGPLMRAALGASRQATTTTTTKASGNTGTVLQIEDADISKFNIGDIILIKQSGAYHVSPITAKDSTVSAANITLLVPKETGSFSNSVVIEKFSTYLTANSGHPTLSISKYTEDTKLETAAGCRASSMSLENFSTGQLANWAFSFEGLSFGQSLTAPGFTPSYDASLPPIVLSACVYQDGTKIPVNELSFSLENTLAFKTSTCAPNGKMSSRITARAITGSFNPYKQADSTAQFDKFNAGTSFSLFGFMAVPTSTAGEFEDVVGFYMPDCMITEISEADQDGLLQENLNFSATRGSTGSTEELYIGTI